MDCYTNWKNSQAPIEYRVQRMDVTAVFLRASDAMRFRGTKKENNKCWHERLRTRIANVSDCNGMISCEDWAPPPLTAKHTTDRQIRLSQSFALKAVPDWGWTRRSGGRTMARRACRALPDPVISRGTSLVGAGPTRRFTGFGTEHCQVLTASRLRDGCLCGGPVLWWALSVAGLM